MIKTEYQTAPRPQVNVFQQKWGYVGTLGFSQVPDLLLKAQSQLGLDCTELVILLNVISHWWYKGRNPFPTTFNLANRAGVSMRTAQRTMKALESKGMIRKLRGTHGKEYDLEPLVNKLHSIAIGNPINAQPLDMDEPELAENHL